MNGNKQSRSLLLHIITRTATTALAIAEVFALTVVMSQSAQAQTPAARPAWSEKVLHSLNYTGTDDGAWPSGSVIFDRAGNLYGTAELGGSSDLGMVFELTPNGSGSWSELVLNGFNGPDGYAPSSELIFDAAGNLYGTTQFGGGTTGYDGDYGGGEVFELTPNGSGGWTEQVLYGFCPQGGNCTDGDDPWASPIFDAQGNLYGTTEAGGAYSGGTVFELTPNGSGGWTEQVLHSFNNNSTDGDVPYARLIFDRSGNLYGTTYYGGVYRNCDFSGCGTVFELTPNGSGGWTESVLYSFGNGTDGSGPYSGLIFDSAGNLYGTTAYGGEYGNGTVFELTPNGDGGWTEQVLYSFNNGTDGIVPAGDLIFDGRGNLYGTTVYGGTYSNCPNYPAPPTCGTVFELTPQAGGGWTGQVLHSFNGNGADGWEPWAGLILDANGNLYGTTYYGGTYGWGTVFEVTPVYPCATCSHAVRP